MRVIESLASRVFICCIALLALTPVVAAQTDPVGLDGDGPWVVRVKTVDREVVRGLAQWYDVWSVHPEKGFVLVEVDRPGAGRLIADGFAIEVDAQRTARLQEVLGRAEPGPPLRIGARNQTSGIPGFPCYRTVEETFADAAAIAAAHPDFATWTDVGDSWEKTQSPTAGYDMNVLRLTQAAVPGPKPILFLSCAIHAREYTTAELCLRFAERLVDGYDVDPDATWLLDHQEVHLLLHTNPDGRKMAETGLSWRKNTNNDYCSNTSSRGADLNRNFDFQWGCCGGSSSFACSTTYRGPFAASEPEIQVLQAYVASVFPDQRPDDLVTPAPTDATGVAMDIHSYGQLLLWPWGFDYDPAPNSTQLQTLGRKLAYFNGHDPGQGTDLYVTDGSSKDFYYGTLGVAAFVSELGTQFFESCNYFAFDILEQNLETLLYAAKAARAPYMEPAGPEPLGVAVPPRAVEPGDLVAVSATLDDTRYSTLDGIEPSQAIAAAELYVDVPPWETGATPLAMGASDGLFDSTIEGVEATLDTTGLAVGRHTLFVRGQDAAGNWGVVSAVFLHVIDSVTAPTLQGTVLDAGTAAPVAATVRAGDFETTTDGAGVYSMRLPAGSYDVTVVATGYRSATTEGVAVASSQTTVEDFALRPFAGIWADDAEAGNPGWTAGAPWAITTERAFSPTHAWSDSPGSLYANNANVSLTSPVFDLTDYSGTLLSFRHIYDLEPLFDFARVEVSTDGGGSWSEAAIFGGKRTDSWALEEIPLLALDGQAQARLRFRLETDDSVREDGWFLDDILLEAVYGQVPECSTDPECDDGLFCNGAETCAGGTCQPGSDPCPGQSCDEGTDTCVALPTAQLEWGSVSVGAAAVTVPLSKVYTSPVVVTAVQYSNNTAPVVPRISNVTPTSFDLRLQNPAGGTPVADQVSYLVVEEGVWTVDGVTIEAWTYTSTVTDENNSWVGEDQTYGQSYTAPVVVGQVMSTNDPGWSVFWDRGATRLLAPTATELGTGKHVAEDTDVTRADEVVGVVVFEAGHGTLGGVEYEAAQGPDSVRGVDNSPPYPYTFVTPFATAPTVALVTQAGMQSSEGSWAQVHGPTLATPTTLYLSVDEDQIGKSERRHSTEQVGYVVFAAPGVIP